MPDFDMGAYGGYVWPAWGVSVLILVGLAVRTVVSARRWKAGLQRDEDRASTAADAGDAR